MTPDEARQRALSVAKDTFSDHMSRHREGLFPEGAALEAALVAYESAMWQPIETAPRDGTLICGWGPVAWYGSEEPETRNQPEMVQMVWEGSDGSIEDRAEWKVPTPTPYEYYCWATHWRPNLRGAKSRHDRPLHGRRAEDDPGDARGTEREAGRD